MSESSPLPKPKLDLFHDSPRLVAKKFRSSTPSLRPPKPPTKTSTSIRRSRQDMGVGCDDAPVSNYSFYSKPNNLSLQNNLYKNPNLSSRNGCINSGNGRFFPKALSLNETCPQFTFHGHNHSFNQNNQSTTSTQNQNHEGSFLFGLQSNSILEDDEEQQNNNNCRLNRDFEILCKIGSGNFGDVYKVKSRFDQSKYYAIKRTLMPFTSEADRRRKYQEVRNHQLLPPHENCVRYYNSWEEDGYLYIQTELCQSSLNEIIERNDDNKLPEDTIWKYLIDLLLAIKHLHDHELLHLDIKPDNIFISFDDQAKLGDFGLMCDYKTICNSSHTMFDVMDSIEEGDSKYLASETMQSKFTKAADIYSLGISMFEAASGMELPSRGETYHKLRQNQVDESYFNGLSEDLIYVIKLMMEANYRKRPLVDQLLQLDVVRARRSPV